MMQTHNLGQNIVNKFLKLKKKCFSVKCFRRGSFQFSRAIVNVFALPRYLALITSILGIFLKLAKFLRSIVLSRLATRMATRTFTF